ncbi:hypothetical protein SAMN05444141_108245 [Pseudovibrio denitrificans]|uniref:NHLP leader peptide domain-containing protein n=1 Tax=Pseudovibrio denitrificans TaxID=258256 RepID=A0A1I7DEW9_9HYPH|nr:hypothetical protein [Pseudovibrio denitrificans]SFU10147.1 hypothetical protein SAMN05444141_108245 [Pseudovibrio denitrificans]
MERDFELLLTRRMWEDPAFAELAERDAGAALKQLGVEVDPAVKVRIIQQREDTLYLTIPPAKPEDELNATLDLNQMDLWFSGDMFVWLSSVYNKVKLLGIRSSIAKGKGEA